VIIGEWHSTNMIPEVGLYSGPVYIGPAPLDKPTWRASI
jgi:hypothetical protein